MSDEGALAGDIVEWDFPTGEALKIVSASRGNLDYWHSAGIAKATPHWGGGLGIRRRWLFTDLVAVEIVWRLADEVGYDVDRLRGKDLALNVQLAQAMFGWDLAIVLTPKLISVRTAGSVQDAIDGERAHLAIVALVEPIATHLAITARSLRAEAQV